MSNSREGRQPERETARDQAMAWLVKRDRGLTGEERAQFSAWLAEDTRHAATFAQAEASWRLFRSLASEVRATPQVAAPTPRIVWLRPVTVALAAAAVLALLFFSRDRHATSVERPGPVPALTARADNASPTNQRLTDGSEVRLKTGAAIEHEFTSAERRVRVLQGEVFFSVAKDPNRPFVVEVGGAAVQAVGTAFAVRLESRGVDVLVTEGTVQVTPGAGAASAGAALVTAGHRAVVASPSAAESARVEVREVSPEEVARSLAWQDGMVELEGATLEQLAVEFAQRTGRTIKIDDPVLRSVRIGGRVPMSDPELFIRALEKIYDVTVTRRENGVIELSRAASP